MELDTPPVHSRMGDAYECAERLTKAEMGSFAYNTQIPPEESSSTTSRMAMPHVNVPDMMQHKRAKVHWCVSIMFDIHIVIVVHCHFLYCCYMLQLVP